MSNLLENLNEQQLKAVTHVDGPLLIVAGAGTGKTTVITRRIAYLIEQKLAKPEQILALTFTDKAAGEMEERADQLVELGVHDFWISTFHSFCERIIKQHGLDIGLSNDFKLLDQTQQWIFIYKNFDKFKLDYYRPIGSPNRFIDSLLDHFSKCKDELITPEDYLNYAESLKLSSGDAQLPIGTDDDTIAEIKRVEELANAYHTYQKLMLDNEYMDFGDLIHYCIQLFQKRPNLLRYYQQQFKFVMVDEFQDTNVAQYELIKLLTTNKDPNAIVPNLVVVGDDDQSIYKFRGASVSNILKIKEDFPTIQSLTLVDNYRSSQKILDLAYDFIQHNNPNRLEVKLNIDKRLKGHTKDAAEIKVLEGKDLSEELNLAVTKALELKEQFPDATWNDFCILTRSNSAASEIIPVLEAKQIPFSFVANRGLYKKPLIADLISYLKLLDNYHESSALYRILNFPKFKIDALDVAHLTQFRTRRTMSLYETMQTAEALEELSETSKTKIAELLKLMEKHAAEAGERSAVEAFVQIVDDLGVAQLLDADTLENAQNRELLEQFYKKVETHAQEAEDRTMRGFLAELNLEFKAGEEGPIKFDPNSGPESLKVMTIHSAKGLEFKFCFIVNLVDQRFPTRAQRDAIELPTALVKDILPEGDFHLQEERRLFYVALTRAKTHLYLSWGLDYGGAKFKKPSLFLQETNLVPSEHITKATGKVVFTPPKSKPRKVVYKQLPETFSFSQIATFINCPQEYKYRYYLRLPLPGNHHLSFGSTIHTVLQKYMEEYLRRSTAPQQDLFTQEAVIELPPEKLLEDLYEKEWLDDWYESKEQKEQYRARGHQILKSFYERTQTQKKEDRLNPKHIEQSFSMKLGDKEQYTFNGKIDRADIGADNKLQIIDYKTSEKVPAKTAGGDVDQLRIYQWAAEEYFHEPVENLQYWYLYPNETIAVPLAKPEELKELKDKLVSTIEEIRDAVKYDKFAELHKKSKRHTCNYEDIL